MSFALGCSLSFGLALAVCTTSVRDFGFFVVAMSVYHLMEYLYAHTFQPKDCTVDSFLLNQSPEYQYAIAAAVVEYWVEWLFFPSLKGNAWIMYPALAVTVVGQIIRSGSMFYAGRHFHHQIRFKKEAGHSLVTTGPYAYLRHPSYFGWFWWSIATQVMLGNPLCIPAFAYAGFKFFQSRILTEERTLLSFFGDDWVQFRARTPVGIPFIP